jgi:hypothetical protein
VKNSSKQSASLLQALRAPTQDEIEDVRWKIHAFSMEESPLAFEHDQALEITRRPSMPV